MYRTEDNKYHTVMPPFMYVAVDQDGYRTYFPGFVRAKEYVDWQNQAEDRHLRLFRLPTMEEVQCTQ